MTTEIALTTKVAERMKPKIRKSELIEAMARRKYELLKKQVVENQENLNKASAELRRLAEEFAAKMPPTQKRPTDWSWNYSVSRENPHYGKMRMITVNLGHVDIYPEYFTPEIRKQAELVSKFNQSIRCLPMYSEVLREVRAALAETRMKSERVDALLADPATLKAIDRTLEQLG